MQQIGQKVKQTARIAGDIKLLMEVGSFMKNAMSAAAPIAAIAL